MVGLRYHRALSQAIYQQFSSISLLFEIIEQNLMEDNRNLPYANRFHRQILQSSGRLCSYFDLEPLQTEFLHLPSVAKKLKSKFLIVLMLQGQSFELWFNYYNQLQTKLKIT